MTKRHWVPVLLAVALAFVLKGHSLGGVDGVESKRAIVCKPTKSEPQKFKSKSPAWLVNENGGTLGAEATKKLIKEVADLNAKPDEVEPFATLSSRSLAVSRDCFVSLYQPQEVDCRMNHAYFGGKDKGETVVFHYMTPAEPHTYLLLIKVYASEKGQKFSIYDGSDSKDVTAGEQGLLRIPLVFQTSAQGDYLFASVTSPSMKSWYFATIDIYKIKSLPKP